MSKTDNITNDETAENNPVAKEVVDTDNELKQWLVNYVGTQLGPKDQNVTVEMIVQTIAQEFPEFLQVVAEENFFRGYHQALTDVDTGQKELFSDAAQEYATQSGVLKTVKKTSPTLSGRKNAK